MNRLSRSFVESDDLNHYHSSTPNKEFRTDHLNRSLGHLSNFSPSAHSSPFHSSNLDDKLYALSSRILSFNSEISRSNEITLEQRTSIADTLQYLLRLVDKLTAEHDASQIVRVVPYIENLLESLGVLVNVKSTFAHPPSPSKTEPSQVKYGIFQDRLTNLSPSVSSKSNYDLKEDLRRPSIHSQQQGFPDHRLDDKLEDNVFGLGRRRSNRDSIYNNSIIQDDVSHIHNVKNGGNDRGDDDDDFDDSEFDYSRSNTDRITRQPAFPLLPQLPHLSYTPTSKPAFNISSTPTRQQQNNTMEFSESSRRNTTSGNNRTKSSIRPSMFPH